MRRDLPAQGPVIASAASLLRSSLVRVRAPGRLHLGFLDPAATLGRRFGSLGLVVDGFETVVEMRCAATERFSAADAAGETELPRARAHVRALKGASDITQPLHLHIRRALPSHAGFGSGTQLGLAIGRGFASLFERPLETAEIARITGRGLRSGVGVAGFDRGGLLLDGGPGTDAAPAPLLARLDLPGAWRVVVVLDPGATGLHGDAEREALATLAPLPREIAAELCHEVLMRVLAGAATADFELFARGLSRMQQRLGEHFAPAQRGSAFASPAVGRLVAWLGAHTLCGTGQSSWGPTGFAVFADEAGAQAAVAAARAAGAIDARLGVQIVASRSHGATVDIDPAA